MIYIDTSVALAHVLPEQRKPPTSIWREQLVSSQLLEYELWNRVYAYQLASADVERVRELLSRILIIDLVDIVLERALRPFPIAVRTLDGLHLATLDFLRGQGHPVELASYDNRMLAAARAMGVPIAPL